MKSVRFSQVVAACGRPEVYLLFTDPAKDEAFQHALKNNRIMTLHEKTSGAKTAFGRVGYEREVRGQLLIFPRSLKVFDDAQIVGLKYDLIKTDVAVPDKNESAKLAAKPAKESAAKKMSSTPKQSDTKSPPATREIASEKSSKVIPFQKNSAPRDEPAPDDDSEIKVQVRRAMKALEDGRQVAAFNLLKRILENDS